MPVNNSTLPPPPRQTGDIKTDLKAVTEWAWHMYRVIVSEQQIPSRLNQIAEVDPLTTSISASPTQAQVEEIRDKVNLIIAAAAPI